MNRTYQSCGCNFRAGQVSWWWCSAEAPNTAREGARAPHSRISHSIEKFCWSGTFHVPDCAFWKRKRRSFLRVLFNGFGGPMLILRPGGFQVILDFFDNLGI